MRIVVALGGNTLLRRGEPALVRGEAGTVVTSEVEGLELGSPR
jgi:carbamate kinase